MKGSKFLTLLLIISSFFFLLIGRERILIISSLYRQSAGAKEDTPVSRFRNSEPSKWIYPPFAATETEDGKIYARGAQDDKCTGMQYLEAIRELKFVQGYSPVRTVHISYVPDEENGAAKFAGSEEFKSQASTSEKFRVFYADRLPWKLIIKALGMPGHESMMFDNRAMENLMKSVEIMTRYREGQFDLVTAGLAMNSEVISVNPVYMKAGAPSPTGYQMNMQPSEVEAGFDIRFPPTADPELLRKRIVDEWAPHHRNMTYEIEPIKDQLGPYRCLLKIIFTIGIKIYVFVISAVL
ncbi:hypothetical protein MKW92_013579 [Papaver armeniacum]|nr:hypothetical protein MKW92_013579 [Papaver armeniacum]